MDVRPYKLSAFASHNQNTTITAVDTMKFVLVIYTCYIVFLNFQKEEKIEKMFRCTVIMENMVDLTIIFLQTYGFALKVQDSKTFDVIIKDLLGKKE